MLFCHLVTRGAFGQIILIGGYDHFDFRETLSIQENVVSMDPAGAFPQGTVLNVVDQFATSNEFEGGQFGAEFLLARGHWKIDGAMKLGIGNVHEVANLTGSTIVTEPSNPVFQMPGFLVQPSNAGLHSRDRIAFLAEVDLNLHYQLANHCDFIVGYTFMILTRAVRAGEAIDTSVDSTPLPTALNTVGVPGNQPAFSLHDTSLWAQGISGGIELRF